MSLLVTSFEEIPHLCMHAKQALAKGTAQSLLGGVSLCTVSSAKALAPDRVTEYSERLCQSLLVTRSQRGEHASQGSSCKTGLDNIFAQSLLRGLLYSSFASDRVTEYFKKTLPVTVGDKVSGRKARM